MKKLLSTLIVFLVFVLFATKAVMAGDNPGQYGQYGGPTGAGKVLVDKLVRHPQTGVYVDNLGLSDPMFSADSSVFFKITVENTGNATLNEVKVIDYLPAYLQYVSGGTYDSVKREVRFSFSQVAPGERRSTVLQTKVYGLTNLPAEKTVLCPVNKVMAYSDQDGADEDTAQLCIKKKPMVAKEAPKAGMPLDLVLGLGSLPTLLFGFKLKRQIA